MSVNKVILIGNLGRDPEIRYSANGNAIANLNIATTHRSKGPDGQWNEQTEWHRIVLFGRTAEVAGQYLRKGRPVYIEGRIQTRKWQDQSGQDRYTTEVIGEQMQMLGGRDGGGMGDAPMDDFNQDQAPRQAAPQRNAPQQPNPAAAAAPQQNYQAPSPTGGMDDLEDDIPF